MKSHDAWIPARPDAATKRAAGDMRDMQFAECPCGYSWSAPVIGRCPKCRREGAAVVANAMIGVPRV